MATQPVYPLRIQKGTPGSSPVKMGASIPRALTELAPTERRRNSPSFNHQQITKKIVPNVDSSPFQSSPFNASEGNSSPRLFWQGRDPATPNRFITENGAYSQRDCSPSPTRRSSIERLQRASRVKNSNMFAREQKQEYDPASVPVIERPLARQVQGNAYGGTGLEGLRSEERGRTFGPTRSDSVSKLATITPTKTPIAPSAHVLGHSKSPSKDQISPTKSSLAQGRFNSKPGFDPENGTWSEETSGDERELPEGRILHRHAKSVTFDAAPPQVNEYEMATPDLSSIGTVSRENSYDSGEEDEDESFNNSEFLRERDDSFDASLEDTDKTPVVGPEDWRHASPSSHAGVVKTFEDPFDGPEGSPMPGVDPSSPTVVRPSTIRNDSLNSNGDHRPLPPLPGMTNNRSSIGLSAAAERAGSAQRGLPAVPAAASFSKSDIQSLAGGKMPLEERLRLMMIQDDDQPKTAAELQRERRMRRGGARDHNSQTPERDNGEISIHEDEDTLGDLGEYQLPPRISRESILRKVNGQDTFSRESDYNFSSPIPSSSPERPAALDPDVPLPSTEDKSIIDNNDDSVIIKPEQDDDDVDVYSIPEMYHERAESRLGDYDINESIIREGLESDEYAETESQYSEPMSAAQSPQPESSSAPEDEGPPTPRAASPIVASIAESDKGGQQVSLPEFSGFLAANDFGLSLQSYMTPSPPPVPAKNDVASVEPSLTQSLGPVQRPCTPPQTYSHSTSLSKPEYDGTGWGPEEGEQDQQEEYEEVGTPESVVHHRFATESPPRESPVVPERMATIKAAGSKLKTRPSATPSDLMAMREARRHISSEHPSIPPIPQRHRNRPSLNLEGGLDDSGDGLEEEVEFGRKSSLKKKSLTLDIGGDLGLGLDADFDRVIEAQKVAFNLSSSHSTLYNTGARQVSFSSTKTNKILELNANIAPRKQRGYLMRQNTKLVVASSDIDQPSDDFRGTRSAGNSPVKKERPQSWTVEPWNGQTRRKSLKDSTSPRKKTVTGPVPPMPGHNSNGTGLGIVTEEEQAPNSSESDSERGRLFVKVIGVKELDLPLPRNERTWFSLTLDNGVHCVTTAWLELGKNAPIGQEFELVVPNDLEFQLTLNAKLEKPVPRRVVESPTKSVRTQKPSTFSRVFASPKKRKELEMRQKEEEQRMVEQKQRELQAKRMSTHPTAWDLISPLAAADGSFGRSYVCLKDHETRCFGRPYVVEVACFNEWATEEATAMSSVKSKRGNTHVQRRAPYKVAKLELQLLFVPKPKGAKEDDIPKSMNSCIREMKDAEQAMSRSWEGALSQQGGDCPYWRRRYFKLAGSRLTAYHETTRQPRATINLANASKLIDDRRSLTQKETTGKGGSRRKSGFAEEEEGYMFVEEGFRIRFANGEVIDFYADTAQDKEGWMKILDQCIGVSADSKATASWCELVLKEEESIKRREVRKLSGEKAPARYHARTKSMII